MPGSANRRASRAAQDERQRLAAVMVPQVVALVERICVIPAPTFEEAQRATFVAVELTRLGLSPDVDEMGNVVARRPGRGDARSLMFAAHTDTVFPRSTPLTVVQRESRLIGPAVGDNCLGVAAVLELIALLEREGIETPGDLILAFNVGEEGLGNLRGIRALTDRFESELGGVVAVEGHNLGRVTHIAVGSRRARITVEGPGGHSWGAFGQPSAIHVLCRIVSRISAIRVPSSPKTTYNVGMIEGGISVNTIAPTASAVLDTRSVDPAALERLWRDIQGILDEERAGRVRVEVTLLGERPAGSTPASAPLVRAAADVLRDLGVEPYLNASSTDANIPIARGIPAICVGISRGSGAHRVDETIEIEPIALGLAQLLHLAAAFPVG